MTFGPLMLGAVCSQWTRLPGSRPDVRWMDDDRYRRRIIDGATITGCDPRSLCTILGLGRSARRGGCGVVVRTSSQALVKGLSAVDGATFEYESAARSPGNDEAILHS